MKREYNNKLKETLLLNLIVSDRLLSEIISQTKNSNHKQYFQYI